MSNVKKSLRERAQEMQAQLKIMQGREKGDVDDLIGVICDVDDFDFMEDDGHKYVVFTVKEDPANFFFGGQVLTDQLLKLQEDGYLEEIQKEGLPMLLSKKMSKSKRSYTNVTFYPEG